MVNAPHPPEHLEKAYENAEWIELLRIETGLDWQEIPYPVSTFTNEGRFTGWEIIGEEERLLLLRSQEPHTFRIALKAEIKRLKEEQRTHQEQWEHLLANPHEYEELYKERERVRRERDRIQQEEKIRRQCAQTRHRFISVLGVLMVLGSCIAGGHMIFGSRSSPTPEKSHPRRVSPEHPGNGNAHKKETRVRTGAVTVGQDGGGGAMGQYDELVPPQPGENDQDDGNKNQHADTLPK